MRRLSPEETALWRRIRRSIRPLRLLEAEPESAAVAMDEAKADVRSQPGDAPVRSPAPVRSTPPPLAALEARARRRLARGIHDVDARIDLHGMHQERAFAALTSFLRHSQVRGAKLVLVITGKGRGGEGRGVLRDAVPAWLARADLRDLVLGFEEAGRRHGGGGALYVRLRRRGGAGRNER